MQFKKYITLLASALLLFACAKEEFDTPTSTPDGPVTVGFWVGRGDTRTETPNAGFEMDAPLGAETTRTHASSFGNDKLSVSWSNGDQVAMWAKPTAATEEDAFTFSNHTFKNWFVSADSQKAYFTTTLDNAMPAKNENDKDITYNYYVCYPTPASANGTITTFTIPSTQDGKMGGGADIMMAQGSGIALQSLVSNNDFVVDKPDGYPSFTMKHLIHSLMFYVPAGEHWGFPDNETIERIVFTMPSTATGIVTADVKAAAPALALQTAGSNTIALNLTDPIGPSSGNDLDFAAASIIPDTYTGDLTVKVYSQTKASQVTFSGIERNMAANHVTPVVLNCSQVTDRPKISFRIKSNNLGEQPYKITLTSAETSTQWKDGDDHIYEYYTGSEASTIANGSGFDIYYDEETISSISGETVTVTYESKSAIVTETITMPAMTNGDSYSMNLNVPYLLFEDFTNLHTNFEYDDVRDASTMSADGHLLDDYMNIKGWNGSHIKGVAGQSVRVNVRHESTLGVTRSNGRLDTPAMKNLKDNAKVSLKVIFDMGAYVNSGYSRNNDVFLIAGKHTNPDDAATNGLATTKAFGNVADDTSRIPPLFDKVTLTTEAIPNNYNNDSFNSTFSTYDFTATECTLDTRFGWIPCCKQSTWVTSNNAHYYLYLDNIKVQIVP